MNNFSNKKNLLNREFNNLNGASKIFLLNKIIKEYLEENLKYKSHIWDIFSFEQKNNCFVVKDSKDSKVLRSHFKGIPVVPGIMMKLLLLSLIQGKELNKNDSMYCKTIFCKSGVPGSKIFLGEDGRSLVDENGEKYITIDYIDKIDGENQDKYKKGFRKIKKIQEDTKKKLPNSELNKYLLQVKKFRFAHNSNFKLQKEEGEAHIGDIFSGQYKLSPSDICFFNTNRNTEEIYNGFFEEITAQIGSLAMGKILGEVNGDKSKILTFRESIFKFDYKKLKNKLDINSIIKINGMLVRKDKRCLSFIFIGKNEKGENLFRGEISGNIMSAKILEKMSKEK